MIFVLVQLLFSSCIDQWRAIARQTLTELERKFPLPKEGEARETLEKHWEIFRVGAEKVDQTASLPDPQEFLEMMLAETKMLTASIAAWIRRIVEEQLPLTLQTNDKKLSCADLLNAFFAGNSLVSCAKVSAHGAKDAHEIVNYIHDIFHTILFYRARVALMFWIQGQIYKDSWEITKKMVKHVNIIRSMMPDCCSCCCCEGLSEEENAIAQTGFEHYKRIMKILQSLAENDPKAQAALFWFLHETDVWKPHDFDEANYAVLLTRWKERAVSELNRPESWQKKHTEATGFGFVYRLQAQQKIKKQLKDCGINPTDELIHDYKFWEGAKNVLFHMKQREEAEAYIQETCQLAPPYTIAKFKILGQLGWAIFLSNDTVSSLATEAEVTLTPEQMGNKEFGRGLWSKLCLIDEAKGMETQLQKLLHKLDISDSFVPSKNFWKTLQTVCVDIGIFNDKRLDLTESGKESQQELIKLDLKVLSETTNFRKVQVYGNKIHYLPTDQFLHQNAWDLYRILKYTAGMTDLQSPQNVTIEGLADYLDLLQKKLIECFDHLIAKAGGQVSAAPLTLKSFY